MGSYFDCRGILLGPYFIKSWVPIGSLFLSFEVPISFGNSVTVRYLIFLLMTSLRADAEIFIFGEICTPGAGGIGWYRAKVIMALKNLLGLLGASIVHKYGHDNQKSD